MILLAFRRNKNAGYRTLIFLMCTNLVFFTFTGLKQSYAIGFSALLFSNMLAKEKKELITLENILLIILASLFHTTGFILILLYLLFLIQRKNNRYTMLVIFGLAVVLVAFQPLCLLIAKVSSGVFPSLSVKLLQYFGNSALDSDSGSMVFIKGTPFYALFLYGCIFRKAFKNKNSQYDSYLILTGIASLFFLASAKQYWMYRFTYMFYFPMGVFYDQLIGWNKRGNQIMIMLTVALPVLVLNIRELTMIFSRYGGF